MLVSLDFLFTCGDFKIEIRKLKNKIFAIHFIGIKFNRNKFLKII
jgi:hypothetical protein